MKDPGFNKMITDKIFDMLFDCYPPDMENFNSMTEDQAYRLLKKFWKKVEKLNY